MYNLLLYDRLAISTTNFRGNITQIAQNWQSSKKAIGGYWIASFRLSQEHLTRGEIIDFYNQAIGWRIVEMSFGATTWEGRISELTLTIDGAQYTRSLDPENWHNKVAVRYPPTITDWGEDADSIALYGESWYVDSVGGAYTSTAAEARRDRRIAQYGFPHSRATGTMTGTKDPGIRVDVICAGYAFTINQRFRTTDTAAAAISTQVGVLIGESEFVTAGSVDTNSMSVPISVEEVPERLWDLIEELIGMGDASGNEWVGGVYAGRLFNYKAASTSATYFWKNQKLYDASGLPVLPPHIKADSVAELGNVPRGRAVPGGAKPSRIYIDQVEFIAPDGFILTPREGPQLVGRG